MSRSNGSRNCSCSGRARPTLEVYRDPHELLGNTQTMNNCGSGNLTAPLSASEVERTILKTIGHETGHSVHICHSRETQSGAVVYDCPGLQITGPVVSSVMTSGFDLPIPQVTDAEAQYSATDSGQVRLHVRQ
jgi:hypothetical protein